MQNRNLISVRSNCDFGLNYETGKLHAQTEVILICSSPIYTINQKKGQIEKSLGVDEFRFKSDLEGLNKLIGELQLVVKNMNNFEQLSASLNGAIEANKPKD